MEEVGARSSRMKIPENAGGIRYGKTSHGSGPGEERRFTSEPKTEYIARGWRLPAAPLE
jgi:hypothetical protein